MDLATWTEGASTKLHGSDVQEGPTRKERALRAFNGW